MLPKLVNSEGTERAEVLTEILKTGYPFLRQPFELSTATPRLMQEQFAREGALGGTIDKCINFFLAAARDAGVEVSPHLRNMRGTRIARARPRIIRETTAGPNGSGSGQIIIGSDDGGDMSWRQMLLSKFPSFDPAWPDDVKTKWFDAFDRLMKQGQKVETE